LVKGVRTPSVANRRLDTSWIELSALRTADLLSPQRLLHECLLLDDGAAVHQHVVDAGRR
jgi:hypothetical protein